MDVNVLASAGKAPVEASEGSTYAEQAEQAAQEGDAAPTTESPGRDEL